MSDRVRVGILYYEAERVQYWFMCSNCARSTLNWLENRPGNGTIYRTWDVYKDQIYPYEIPCSNCIKSSGLSRRGVFQSVRPEEIQSKDVFFKDF